MAINKTPVREALSQLHKARQAATMQNMCVSPPAQASREGLGDIIDDWNEAVRESTHLYRQTWILYPIDLAIELLEGELNK